MAVVPCRKGTVRAERNQAAKLTLHGILRSEGLESRHYLQAWYFLRRLGERPLPDEAKHVYGVVVEVALGEGLDIVAGYEDLSARYFNYSGAAIVWEHPDSSLDENVQALLAAGRNVVARIGAWNAKRPPTPADGQARINMLTPSGLHFGQAALETLSRDALAGTVMSAALTLMQSLIARTG